jgi:hypothetical protein
MISNVVVPDDCPVELVPAKISSYEEGTTISQELANTGHALNE